MAKYGTSGSRVHMGESMGQGPSHGSAQRHQLTDMVPGGKQKKFVAGKNSNTGFNKSAKVGGGMKTRESSEE